MAFLNKIKNLISGGNTLYYPGCLTKFVLPKIYENYKTILKNYGIEFITLSDEEFCCGSPVLNAGFTEDFYDLKKKNYDFFKKYGVNRIITNCPACYYVFKNHYPDIKVEHVISVLHKKINKIKTEFDTEISYHDPCHLGRKSGIYKEPRDLLEKLGFRIVELIENKELSLCCGGGGNLINNFPEISNKISKLRLSQCKVRKLITPCPMCYKHLKDNSDDVEVIEFSEVFL